MDVNLIGEDDENYEMFKKAGEKIKPQPNSLQILAHGYTKGIQDQLNGGWILDAKTFNEKMNILSTEWSDRGKESLTVILYSCRTGDDGTKKYGDSPASASF